MKKYYCLITQEQLNQLINFGNIIIPKYLAIDFTEGIEFIQENLVNTINSFIKFKYDELVLVIETNASFDVQYQNLKIQIVDIEQIFPISDEGLRALTFKYPKINFAAPILSMESLSKVNDAYFLDDIKKGINGLKSVFSNLFQWNNSADEEQITQAALKFRKGFKLSRLPTNSNIIDFTFLYVYQEYYPLNTLGYFYRTAEILIRKTILESGRKIEDSMEIFKKSGIFYFLEELKANNIDYKVDDIESLLYENTSIKIKNFIETLTTSGVKYYIVIPVFLKVIDEFNINNQKIEKTHFEEFINKYKSKYSSECQQLILWLGAYLGYGNCYDYLYLKSNLKVFKGHKSLSAVALPDITLVEKIIVTSKEDTFNKSEQNEDTFIKLLENRFAEIDNLSTKQREKLIFFISKYVKVKNISKEIPLENEVIESLSNDIEGITSKDKLKQRIKLMIPVNEIIDEITKNISDDSPIS